MRLCIVLKATLIDAFHRNGREGSAAICGACEPRGVCAGGPQGDGSATCVQKHVSSQERLS